MEPFIHKDLEIWLSHRTSPELQDTIQDSLKYLVQHFGNPDTINYNIDHFLNVGDREDLDHGPTKLVQGIIQWIAKEMPIYGVKLTSTVSISDLPRINNIFGTLVTLTDYEDKVTIYRLLQLGNDNREILTLIIKTLHPEEDEAECLNLIESVSSDLLQKIKDLFKSEVEHILAQKAQEEAELVKANDGYLDQFIQLMADKHPGLVDPKRREDVLFKIQGILNMITYGNIAEDSIYATIRHVMFLENEQVTTPSIDVYISLTTFVGAILMEEHEGYNMTKFINNAPAFGILTTPELRFHFTQRVRYILGIN